MIGMKVTGTFALDRKLKALPTKVANGIKRKAARRAAKPVLEAARANMPVRTGALKKSLRIRSYKSRKKGIVGVRVVTSSKWFKGKTFYAAFLEFGTRYQPARRPLKRAAQATAGMAQRILIEETRKLVDEVMRKK